MKYLLKLNHVIVRIEQVILAGSIIAMSILLILNVLGRFILHKGIASAEELGTDLIIFITFIGLSYCATTGKHINMLAIFDIMPATMRKGTALLISGVTGRPPWACLPPSEFRTWESCSRSEKYPSISISRSGSSSLIVTLGFLGRLHPVCAGISAEYHPQGNIYRSDGTIPDTGEGGGVRCLQYY